MKEYSQHNIAYHLEFRSPKFDLLLCNEDDFIFKKERYHEYIN